MLYTAVKNHGNTRSFLNKDFIEQFPLVQDIDEYETDEEKILAIGIAMGQYDSEGTQIQTNEDGIKYVLNDSKERIYLDSQ